ncbi:VTT domain-containing protein [Reyranella sp.]|uniref:VTT domain-containing protein n=1 Tax=Reyranella sp. TaxID=1929291 RepID=UPI00273206BE|nr:VTT domain-containing protein [Reyranella sp.]MDP2372546.1 VTT domain-containing protein [Reyranella sp.]
MTRRILKPGRTVWRIEHAGRAAVLVDGAAFFAAVRAAFLKARRSIFIVGWDIDSRTELQGDDPPDDGHPVNLAAFLTDLVKQRPDLQIHLLLWDYSLLYAHEREPLPRLSLQWQMPPQVTFCLDSTVPFGSSQHQKLVIVDDALAFSGGLDLTIRRWDTRRHEIDNALRVDPAGEPYRPFHDIQMMVDGAAARALALLARQRWCHAKGGEPAIEPAGNPSDGPWPDGFPPEFTDLEIGIARTQPRYNGEEGIYEVEALFLESIGHAERSIYIENQFATSPRIAVRLARQLARRPALEVVIVAPRSHDSFLERRTMRNGRIRFWRTVKEAGGDRVRLVYPSVERPEAEGGVRTTHTMIHSKIMVIDDVFLRVGSANMNNRSMGADTECDLIVEAGSAAERAAIARVRDRLLGEHCGVPPEEVAAALAAHGSLVRAADTLSAGGHRLRPIDDGVPDRSPLAALAERIADPPRPLRLGRLLGRVLPRLVLHGRQVWLRGPGLVLGLAALLVVALTLAWQFTGLSGLADPAEVGGLLEASRGAPWAVLVVMAVFLVGGAAAFPVTVMIVATAAVFGPWWGMLYAALGVAASALAMYGLGARFGQEALAGLLGARWERLQASLRRRGLLAMVAVRVVPVAPFTLVNLAAGASPIRLADFVLGTLIGMGPGLAVLCLMGDRIVRVFHHPVPGEIALLALSVAVWIGLSFAAQAVVARLGGRTP